MASIPVFLIPGNDVIDVEFEPAEGVDPKDLKALCKNTEFIEAVKENTEYDFFVLVQTMDEEEKYTEDGIVCVSSQTFVKGDSVLTEYDGIFNLKGRAKRDATNKFVDRIRSMNEITSSDAFSVAFPSLIGCLEQMTKDKEVSKSNRDKAKVLLDTFEGLFETISGKAALCDGIDVAGGRTITTPNDQTKAGYEMIEKEYNKYMAEVYDACSSFVSFWKRIGDPIPGPIPGPNPGCTSSKCAECEIREFELSEAKKEVEGLNAELRNTSGEVGRQAAIIKKLESELRRVREESSRRKECEECGRLKEMIRDLESQLRDRDSKVQTLESTVKSLKEEVAAAQSKSSDSSELRVKYNTLAAMNQSLSAQIEHLKKALASSSQSQSQPQSQPQPQPQFRQSQPPQAGGFGGNKFNGFGQRPKMDM